MKAIIEKQVTILPANSGFVSKSDTGREPCIVIIKLFSIPIYRKEVIGKSSVSCPLKPSDSAPLC